MTAPGQGDKPITVVLTDDHAVVRGALKALLEGQDDLEVVGEATDLRSARAAVQDSKPDVLILDVNLPDGLGVDAVAGLRQEAPGTEIVLLTMERDLALARRAIEAGARGYLFKDAAHLELIEAVRLASRSQDYLTPSVAAGLKDEAEGEGPRSLLSPRETEVLRLLAGGLSNAEIAASLVVS